MSNTDYKLLWAKSNPWRPLWKHMLDAAALRGDTLGVGEVRG